MTHCPGVRKGGFSAQLAYMIHLTELSSLHCNKYSPAQLSVTASLFRVKAVRAASQDKRLNNNKQASMDAVPHVVASRQQFW